MQNLARVFLLLCLAGFGLNANAGHLFTQNTINTPINLSGGFCINLPQISMEGASPTTGSTVNLGGDFGSGDVLRLTIEGVVKVFDFDSMPSGWTADGTLILASPNDPDIAALSPTLPFTWEVCALAGNFTLEGFRLRAANGTVNGTGTGLVVQSSVVPIGGVSNVPTLSPYHVLLLVLGLMAVVYARKRYRGLKSS